MWIAYFFRDPGGSRQPGRATWSARQTGRRVGRHGGAAAELAIGEDALTRIGIFLNLFDVHVIRAPIGGRVAAARYTKGRFSMRAVDKASEHNERMAIRIAPPDGPEIIFVLVAGLVARRIVCDLREGPAGRRPASASA